MGTTKKVSAYKMNVLNTNKALKRECKSLGGAVKVLWLFRDEIELSTQYIQILSQIRENDDVYATFKENVRVSKAGNYSPFFVLQAIHKALKNEPQQTQELTPVEKMNVAQLKEVAKKQGKTNFSKMKKAELLALVTA
jgi:hypothetical protein